MTVNSYLSQSVPELFGRPGNMRHKLSLGISLAGFPDECPLVPVKWTVEVNMESVTMLLGFYD